MAYEQRDNSGSIFVNDRKEKDNHPDRTGTAMIDGVMYRIAGWLKQGQKGPFLSLAFKPMEDDQHSRPPQPQQSISQQATAKIVRKSSADMDDDRQAQPAAPRRGRDMDDDIPFAHEWR